MDNGHILALTGAELDAALARAQNALPRDGSVPITRQLMITGVTEQSHIAVEGETHPYLYLNVFDKSDWDHRRTLMLSSRQNSPDITYALALGILDDGTWKDYPVLHTGNKPSGSYTGNGSAASRTISVGGIGKCCVVYGGTEEMACVTPIGAFFQAGGNVKFTSDVTFDGALHIRNAYIINSASTTYNYQVL